MPTLNQNDIDDLTTRLFKVETGCKPGLPIPPVNDMVQLLREARTAIDSLWSRAQTAEAQMADSMLRLDQIKNIEGVWK